jgi:hypothetical protein
MIASRALEERDVCIPGVAAVLEPRPEADDVELLLIDADKDVEGGSGLGLELTKLSVDEEDASDDDRLEDIAEEDWTEVLLLVPLLRARRPFCQFSQQFC